MNLKHHLEAQREMLDLLIQAEGDLSKVEWRIKFPADAKFMEWRVLNSLTFIIVKECIYEFRLAPKPMGRFPQVDLPLAEEKPLVAGQQYFVPVPQNEEWFVLRNWGYPSQSYDLRALERGRVYLTAEDAIAVAKATRVERVE